MKALLLLLFIVNSLFSHAGADSLQWIKRSNATYDIFYTETDKGIIKQVEADIEKGLKEIITFFKNGAFKKLDVYIFPNRTSLNEQWRKDWNMPGFNSECWMIASGVAKRLDILSPLSWAKESCEHNGNDSVEIQQVITHELTHVFHGQQNPNPTFDGMDDLSWLVEGIATYVSGQLTEAKIISVKTQLASGNAPEKLADFWKGKLRYQQAGTLMKYIDEKYGRATLFSILQLTTLDEIMKKLSTTEKELIAGWKNFYKKE